MTKEQNSILPFFPHKELRPIQSDFLEIVEKVVRNGVNLVAHAPTGLGKTAASLSPAIKYAVDNDKTIFFLTSRHTQHKIVIDTLKSIKAKSGEDFVVTDIIGKKHMCVMPGVDALYSSEFSEYCKALREDKKCTYYLNTKNKARPSIKAKKAISELKNIGVCSVNQIVKSAKLHDLCAYELAIMLSLESKAIIADYNYIFNKNIQESFFAKSEKFLEDSIIIVDEAHNLPGRIKELATKKISTYTFKRAVKEAQKLGDENTTQIIRDLEDAMEKLSEDLNSQNYEKKLEKNDLLTLFDYDVEEVIASLDFLSRKVLEDKKQSSLLSLAVFLEAWLGQDKGFLRSVSVNFLSKEPVVTLSYQCLDPSIIVEPVISKAHSTVLMSGTLTPTTMYSELLGISKSVEKEYDSPFPKHNRMNLIVPKTTTKYDSRSEEEYESIANECATITNAISGNSMLFFPSYKLLESVKKYFVKINEKTVFSESTAQHKGDKAELLEKFKSYKDTGAVLLAVVSGSFGEGIDLPGDFLKGVVVVGLPLSTPNLETKSLIEYFDDKFSKGWEYGYIAPALNKVLQNAGRCIRSEKDRGVVVFLDKRYAWNNYRKYLPRDENTLITSVYEQKIKEFFTKK
ncbi:ATP-dependent DNA helicase [Candidatus Woesearchaeota archaeon]|nr:ATP-dependent DNA helicase [Candidatus Woesearchaeota archaeon]